jgi:PKHD-type hydroxylase
MSSGLPAPAANDDVIAVLSVQRVFTPEECEGLVQFVGALPGQPGLVPRAEYQAVRQSTVWPLKMDSTTQWVPGRLGKLFAQANQRYKFELRGLLDAIQIAQYGVSDRFDWHIDLGRGQSSLRKLSVSVQLSDPGEYDGGDLEFQGLSSIQNLRGRGTAIMFPSFLSHRVTPVTRGTRYSLVAWASGPAFR